MRDRDPTYLVRKKYTLRKEITKQEKNYLSQIEAFALMSFETVSEFFFATETGADTGSQVGQKTSLVSRETPLERG